MTDRVWLAGCVATWGLCGPVLAALIWGLLSWPWTTTEWAIAVLGMGAWLVGLCLLLAQYIEDRRRDQSMEDIVRRQVRDSYRQHCKTQLNRLQAWEERNRGARRVT